MSHPIVHIEIPADDPQTAGTFYANVFGWKLDLDPTFNYLQFEAEGGPGGAFVQVSGPMEGGHPGYQTNRPLLYLAADDIDASLGQVEANAGKIVVPKTEIPGVGWYAIFDDPAGNRMALYTSMRGQAG